MKGVRAVYWDLETGRAKRDSESWDDYIRSCGISVACTISSDSTVKFYTPRDESPYDLESLAKDLCFADVSVGFNSLYWDWPVLEHTLGRKFPRKAEVDLLRIIRKCTPEVAEVGDWKLGAIAERNLPYAKLGEGAGAPTLAREGKWGRLAAYVLRDVQLTRGLFELAAERGWLLGPLGTRVETKEVIDDAIRRLQGRENGAGEEEGSAADDWARRI